MGKYALAILVVIFGGVYYYKSTQDVAISPRQMIDDGVTSARQKAQLSQQEEATLRVQIALLDFTAQKGAPPNSLNDLVPTYFDSVPKDPTTGKPFEYHRDGRIPRLGSLPAPSTQTASLAGGTASGSAPTGELVDFVNPNTMAADTFVYDSTGKRDPFKQFDFSARPQRAGASTPLERYSLGQLRLTAVIVDPKTNISTAFVEDAAGKGYPMKMGAKIGDQGGVVVGIESDRLKILETASDFTGKESQRVVEMRIQQQADAKPVKKR
ncbi:MAG: pilus assembly protein PilP [Deltaproteobacteria bacterium]|nr:pilus assembly protein PilP [Deltaproteobacteria bacterium]